MKKSFFLPRNIKKNESFLSKDQSMRTTCQHQREMKVIHFNSNWFHQINFLRLLCGIDETF